jgi:hypothetical protein
MEYQKGVFKMDLKTYHADPAPEPSLGRSTIKDLLFKSPAHAKFNHPRLNPFFKEEEKERFDLGSAAHALLLEGEEGIAILDFDDWRTKDSKAAREEARKDGLIPLLRKQYLESKAMVVVAEKSLMECPELGISNLREMGDSELSYVWQDGGIWFKVRPDWITKDRKLIVDYKTTDMSANPDDFSRNVISNGLDIQADLYSRGVEAIDGTRPKFVFLVQETYEPFLCSFIALPPQFMEMAKQKVDYGIFLWKKCMDSGEWPGYPNQVAWIDLPGWALAAWDYKAQNIGV